MRTDTVVVVGIETLDFPFFIAVVDVAFGLDEADEVALVGLGFLPNPDPLLRVLQIP